MLLTHRQSAFLAFLLLAACAGTPGPTKRTDSESVQIANPASQRCAAEGGTHVIERDGGGGQYGLCIFSDDRECEEWALFRGHCPIGGLKIAGYTKPAARYCAITGGFYTVVDQSGGGNEQGICELPSGKTCDADAYYRGSCGRN
ncbi:MAG TPA: DUF333 domain-containing protein [Nitrospira sp.]